MEEETSTDCLGLVMNFIEHTLRLCNPTCVLGVLKVVVPHNVSLKQLIFLSKKREKKICTSCFRGLNWRGKKSREIFLNFS